MSITSIAKVTASDTITPLYEIYNYTASNSAVNDTLNLPTITCDGKKYKIIRNDNYITSTLTVSSASPNIIYNGSGVSSFLVDPLTSYVLISKSGSWYVISINYSSSYNSRSQFSSIFLSNNGASYITFGGNGADLIFSFAYSGSSIQPITGVYYVIGANGPLDYTITMEDKTGSNIIGTHSENSFDTGGEGNPAVRTMTSISQSLLPTTLNTLTFHVSRTNANGKQFSFFSVLVL